MKEKQFVKLVGSWRFRKYLHTVVKNTGTHGYSSWISTNPREATAAARFMITSKNLQNIHSLIIPLVDKQMKLDRGVDLLTHIDQLVLIL